MSVRSAATILVPPDPASRAQLIARGVLAAGALAIGGLWLGRPSAAAQGSLRERDVRILNFALGLEYLQAAFYGQAAEGGALSGELLEFAERVGEQERGHVDHLRGELGEAAREEPDFDFRELVSDEDRFAPAALVMEEAGVGAYVGQGANLSVAGVAVAAPIISVEARHAAWIRDIVGRNPAPRAADPGRRPAQVQEALRRAGFRLPGTEG